MGKSPAKWIKTLFGKKTTRSQTSKARSASKAGTDKGYTVAKGPPASTENAPVISEPVLVITHNNGVNPELEVGKPSSFGDDGSHILPASQGVETDPEKVKEEQAAIKAQAAFRGFLARRAFHALRGIIRLQALVRGHLVRRQAVVTLRSMLGIVRLQALARGHKVAKGADSRKNKLYTNMLVCKLLSSTLVVMPLQIQYGQGEPNSVSSWMDRWTLSRFWKPPSQLKKTSDSKSQTRRGTYAMETESGRTKRSFKRNSPVNVDSSLSNINSEPEKTKRNMRKVPCSADTVPEHPPQYELEKVKRNLRKVTGSMVETSDRSERESDKQPHSNKNAAELPSNAPHQKIDDSAEITMKDVSLIPTAQPDIEIATKAVAAESPVDRSADDHPPAGPLQDINKDENIPVPNGELNLKEEETFNENQKTNKRRASFSAKPEYTENGVQNTPTLPSYMQATQSAKAKLRGQDQPKPATESAEKNGITRRHSLPSSTNGKVISHSPRTQRILQATSKAGIRSDKSLLSSRDGSDKLIQVEWRR